MNEADLDFEPARLEPICRSAARRRPRAARAAPHRRRHVQPDLLPAPGDWRAVLRKQPAGELAPSAHAIDREFKVLRALHGSSVPVPRPLHYCEDRRIVGTPFYLMEQLDGRVFHAFATPGCRPRSARRCSTPWCRPWPPSTASTWPAVGLADHGRPGNYFERQLRRWGAQWRDSYRRGDDDNPALDRCWPGWRPACRPAGCRRCATATSASAT
jgi:aminoglycoside phosphotransferase (APT) family kinase protein